MDIAIDRVLIGDDAWVIEEVRNRTITIARYDNHYIIQDKIRIVNGVNDTTLPDGKRC